MATGDHSVVFRRTLAPCVAHVRRKGGRYVSVELPLGDGLVGLRQWLSWKTAAYRRHPIGIDDVSAFPLA